MVFVFIHLFFFFFDYKYLMIIVFFSPLKPVVIILNNLNTTAIHAYLYFFSLYTLWPELYVRIIYIYIYLYNWERIYFKSLLNNSFIPIEFISVLFLPFCNFVLRAYNDFFLHFTLSYSTCVCVEFKLRINVIGRISSSW